jgi:pimeloyl-ACP methyl ester carboxylesterase
MCRVATGFTPFIKSGRAVLAIVIKGYPERALPAGFTMPSYAQVEFRDLVVNWFTDCRRGLDYLETRGDIDMSRIAYQAGSAGGAWLFLPAIEPRYRAAVFWGAGVGKWNLQDIPEANPINFVPHIRGPKLMIHGRYDEIILLKIGAEPLYKLLREPKRLVIFEGGHAPPIEVLVPTINGWLDEKLGPVKLE